MKIEKNIPVEGKHNKPIITDVFFTENHIKKPIVIYCHGYKGFKDWGAWHSMAKQFAKAGFFFLKFNFSHNGGTLEQPIDFPDLEAFGNNNFTKELDDLECVIDWVLENKEFTNQIDNANVNLVGHSRGGGIVLLKANENSKVKKVVTLAGVSDYKSRFPTGAVLKQWKKDGVAYITNARTNQQMPHFFQFYENFKKNEARLTIKTATENLTIPHLIIHGDNDTSVELVEAKQLKKWNPTAHLEIINNTDHAFNTSHPWEKEEIPEEFQEIISLSIKFLKEENYTSV